MSARLDRLVAGAVAAERLGRDGNGRAVEERAARTGVCGRRRREPAVDDGARERAAVAAGGACDGGARGGLAGPVPRVRFGVGRSIGRMIDGRLDGAPAGDEGHEQGGDDGCAHLRMVGRALRRAREMGMTDEPKGNVLSMLNRHQRRATEAAERAKTQDAEAIKEALKERLEKLGRVQHILMAAIRPYGRLRIPKGDLDAITTGDRLGVQVQDNGDLVVTLL